jgi:Tfp pilus assembly protein PilN
MIKAIQELKSENDQLKAEMKKFVSVEEQLAEIQGLKKELIKQINLLKENTQEDKVKFSSIENQGD